MKYIKLIMIVGIIFFGSSMVEAQDGKYRVRLVTKCDAIQSNRLTVNIYIRARTNSSAFKLADQNYRFKFNPNALANPEETDIS